MARRCRDCATRAREREQRETNVSRLSNPNCECNHARSFHGGGGVGQRCLALGCRCPGTQPPTAGSVVVVVLPGSTESAWLPALLRALGTEPGDHA